MANAKFSYVNYIDVVGLALTGASPATALAIGNIQIQRLKKVWRSTAAASFFTADFAAAMPIDVIALFGLIMAATDTVRIRLSNVALGNSELLDTGATASGIVPGYNQYVYLTGATINARYMRIDINAPSFAIRNYFELGRCWVGACWSPAINFQPGPEFGFKDVSTTVRAPRSGETFSDVAATFRTANITFGNMTVAERAIAADMDVTVGTKRQLVFIPDPAGDLVRQPILCKQSQLNQFSQPTKAVPFRYSRQYQFEEEL